MPNSASAIATAAEPVWPPSLLAQARVGVEQRIATHPLVARTRARVRPAATGTARTERRAASAQFRPSASARLPARDARPAADYALQVFRPKSVGRASNRLRRRQLFVLLQ